MDTPCATRSENGVAGKTMRDERNYRKCFLLCDT